MAVDINGVQAITDPWPVKDIVYVSIMGTVMLAAFLEWFLWLAAFLYCLVKVFQKAEHLSIRIMSVIMMITFTLLRAIFLPVMIVTLPLPAQVTKYFPHVMVSFLQWFAFWTFAGLLTVPWLFCVYQLVTNSLGRTKRIKTVLDETSAPKVVIVMPCYKEEPEVLLAAIDSIADCDYPPSCLHVFLSFDGDQVDELYLSLVGRLGVPHTLEVYPSSIDISYRNTRITVSRFPHGGKRHCQKKTFKLIDKVYTDYLKRNDNLFVLFIDSDCILDKVCIQNFVYEMELKPGSKHNMLAMTGVITSTTQKNSLITLLQDMEYIHGQLFERSVESGCGSVTCLPGALTILRFSAFRKMAKYYFADKAEQCDDLFDYGKCHLGEDRWLTHLFMIGAKERYQIQMCTGAFCKTEAVQTYKSLLKQRRRWFLGFITNEVCMLTDVRLWRMYPILCIVRFAQNTIRTTALLFFIMVLSIITTSNKIKNLPVGFIAVSLGLNWLLMFYFGLRLRRFKAWLYPIMFIINPFFNWVYMVYGIFTAGQRTWGGPRADAGTADAHTTVQEAIEHAEATGDDLNVVPETFKAATEDRLNKKGDLPSVPVQPTERVEGRFTRPERDSQGWYRQSVDSLQHYSESPGGGRRLQNQLSWDSYGSGWSTPGQSVYMPRKVESLMGDEDKAKYKLAQASQKEPGGLDMLEHQYRSGQVYEMGEKDGWGESMDSVDREAQMSSPGTRRPPPPGRPESSHSANSLTPPRTSPRFSPELAPLSGPSQTSPQYGQGSYSLAIPEASHMPHGRDSMVTTRNNRLTSSPLARGSVVNSDDEDFQLEPQGTAPEARKNSREQNPGSSRVSNESSHTPRRKLTKSGNTK